nr:phosphotyrosine protein phosphatase [Pseudoalteromonas sp. MMG013]
MEANNMTKGHKEVTNILFICSRNKWRSPTGEHIWRHHPFISVRSAGTSAKANRTVNSKDIQWANIIFVMEKKHKNRLLAQFTRHIAHKEIHILDIPDEYQYLDNTLVNMMKSSVSHYLGFSEQSN